MATVSASCPGALWPLLCIHFSTSLVAMAHAKPIRAPPAMRRNSSQLPPCATPPWCPVRHQIAGSSHCREKPSKTHAFLGASAELPLGRAVHSFNMAAVCRKHSMLFKLPRGTQKADRRDKGRGVRHTNRQPHNVASNVVA